MDFSFYSSLSSLIPVLAYIYVKGKITTGRQKYISIFFIFCFISEVIAYVLANSIKNNVISGNIFSLFELFFWCYFLYDVLNGKIHYAFFILLLLSLVAQWINFIFQYSIWKHNAMFSILEASAIMILSAYYLFQLSKDSTIPLHKVPEFWFVSGALIYFTTSFIGLGIPRYLLLTNSSKVLQNFVFRFWSFYSIINILANIIFAKGFLCFSTKKT
jgi:hypothetical protein